MSASSSQRSRFRVAVDAGRATAVPMNGLNCVVFSDTPCIGTDRLGSCSVVLIVSPFAAILAHIAPRPEGANPNDLQAGDNHVRSVMQQVTTFYRACQAYFPANSTSWVVCAVFIGAVALPDQQEIMRTALQDVGLTVDTNQTYRVPNKTRDREQGSVFVDSRGDTIQVYVEGNVIGSIPRGHATQTTATATASASSTDTSSGSSIAATSASSSSGAWVWSQTYSRHYRLKSDGTVEWETITGSSSTSGYTASSSSHASSAQPGASSTQPGPSQPATYSPGTWCRFESRDGYYLVRNNEVVDKADDPPERAWISDRDKSNNHVKWMMWSGNQWQYR